MEKSKNIFFIPSVIFCVILFCSGKSFSFKQEQDGFWNMKYGPNLSFSALGNTPIISDQWMPQTNASVHYNWIEPLGDDLPYGNLLDSRAAFFRMETAFEISPFYENLTLGFGVRPFHVNPQFEFRFSYDNLVYFNSNVEMALINPAEEWNSSYILDHLWESDAADINYMQTFTFGTSLDYLFGSGMLLGINFNFVLVDIETSYDAKSYDYRRNIPLFSRDYILDFSIYGISPINKNFSLWERVDFYKTGKSKKQEDVVKESLGYFKILFGGALNFNDNKTQIAVLPGLFVRTKRRFYNGNIAEQFLVQLQYVHRFDFFHFDER